MNTASRCDNLPNETIRVGQHRGLLSWLSPEAATYIYTVFCKPKWIRRIVQAVVKLFIPNEIQMKGVTLCLNKQDAIVSGALALGCYESALIDYFATLLRPGINMVDIGANIGLYSIISAKAVGPQGSIVAIEPSAENCSFIHKSLEVNEFSNVTVYQKALSDQNGELTLFLCGSNNADHRIYDAKDGSTSAGRKGVIVETVRLDDLLGPALRSKIDLIKLDIQGAEGIALAGMKETLSSDRDLTMVMEFWPWGLIKAGSNPLKVLEQLREFGFSIHEFDSQAGTTVEVSDFIELSGRTLERQHANLVLVKKRR